MYNLAGSQELLSSALLTCHHDGVRSFTAHFLAEVAHLHSSAYHWLLHLLTDSLPLADSTFACCGEFYILFANTIQDFSRQPAQVHLFITPQQAGLHSLAGLATFSDLLQMTSQCPSAQCVCDAVQRFDTWCSSLHTAACLSQAYLHFDGRALMQLPAKPSFIGGLDLQWCMHRGACVNTEWCLDVGAAG